MTSEEMIQFFVRYPYKQDAVAMLARMTGLDKESVRATLDAAGVDWTDTARVEKPPRKKRQTKRERAAAENDRAFRYIFGGILPGVEPLEGGAC